MATAGQWRKVQNEKVPEASGGDLTWYVFSFGGPVACLSITNPKKIFTIET